MSERLPEPRDDSSTSETIAGLLRVAASAGWHTAEWGAKTYARAGQRLLDAMRDPVAAFDLADDVRGAARDLAGVGGIDQRVRDAAASSDTVQTASDVVQRVASAVPSVRGGRAREHSQASLHEMGEALLRRSRDVWNEEEAHPAYERILQDLAPDEGRILLLLLHEGPQPSVDVRTGGPVGILSSRLIEPGLNMIGARAGLRYTDQVHAYLNNLFRLGLVWFSRETLRDPLSYQVVEAQPEVLKAVKSVRFAKIVRRSIHLTPFGEDFCRSCLALDTAEMKALPTHGTPEDSDEVVAPPVVPEDD
jgi:hypothetical protein